MAYDVFWFLPTGGDGRYLKNETGARTASFGYLKQVAQAVDELGFAGALLPTGRYCEEAWVIASSLIPVTKQMKFIIAIRPGLTSPTLAARLAATFDRFSNGRLVLNIVAGGSAPDLAADGLFLEHDERYDLTDEFLTVWREIASGNQNVNFEGKHVRVKGGMLGFPTIQKPYPALYFGGASDAGKAVAAKHADVYLSWGEPLTQIKQQIDDVRRLADKEGREVRFGIRLHIIVRQTESEAWQAADNLIRYVDDDSVAFAQSIFSLADSVGQQRMVALHQGRRDKLIIGPNLWAGIGLVRSGAGTALVGTPEQIAERMQEYADLGIETFIFSGYPHLEEAFYTSELLFPHIPLNPRDPATQEAEPVPAYEIGQFQLAKLVRSQNGTV